MTITTINSQPVAGSTDIGDNKNGQPNGQDITDLIFASLIQGVIQHKAGVLRHGEQLDLESRTAGNEGTVPPVRASDNVSEGADSHTDNSQSSDAGDLRDRPDSNDAPSGRERVNGTSTAPTTTYDESDAPGDSVVASAASGADNGTANNADDVAIAEQGSSIISDVFAQAAGRTNASLNSAQGSLSNAPTTSNVSGAQVVTGNETSNALVKPVVQNLPADSGNNANGQGSNQLPANITIASATEPLVSQPVSNLSSNASLVAQSVSSAAADVTAEEALALSASTTNGSRTGAGSGQTGNQSTSNGTNGGGQALPNAAANSVAGVASETGQLTAAVSST